ncbi:hypothetical protein J7E96_29235 [Streptomyces sp. ISL-96]|uniref:hypothetical protein n=1 Tax=Streptomyces sp. ISL-96 TaxID=2819191 RepID=UPI001BEC314A|nr:hypothetical protein [Streptomyces sp. ISL-96]MBT2492520.1 hypothetical protein [Streptomyces sp. ISL-96]
MPASERDAQEPVSMRDLLASCAAATAVSTPPREPDVADVADVADAAEVPVEERSEQRDAA